MGPAFSDAVSGLAARLPLRMSPCLLAGVLLSLAGVEAQAQSFSSSSYYRGSSCAASGTGRAVNCSTVAYSFHSWARPAYVAPEPPPRRRWNATLLERQGVTPPTPWAPADGGSKFQVLNP
jgi:hypothetical protein